MNLNWFLDLTILVGNYSISPNGLFRFQIHFFLDFQPVLSKLLSKEVRYALGAPCTCPQPQGYPIMSTHAKVFKGL
jgi:hypothetical protein